MQKTIPTFAASAAVLGFSIDARAVGFALEHQSVSNLGYAFAGGAASAEDASTIYWNPAGMTRLPSRQGVLGLNAIYGSARFTDQGTISPAGPASPITGGEGGNPVGLNWVPNLYYTTDLAQDLKAGLGINSPFGLDTKYPARQIVEYFDLPSFVFGAFFRTGGREDYRYLVGCVPEWCYIYNGNKWYASTPSLITRSRARTRCSRRTFL